MSASPGHPLRRLRPCHRQATASREPRGPAVRVVRRRLPGSLERSSRLQVVRFARAGLARGCRADADGAGRSERLPKGTTNAFVRAAWRRQRRCGAGNDLHCSASGGCGDEAARNDGRNSPGTSTVPPASLTSRSAPGVFLWGRPVTPRCEGNVSAQRFAPHAHLSDFSRPEVLSFFRSSLGCSGVRCLTHDLSMRRGARSVRSGLPGQ
jgi:hypothetical protein